MPFEPYPLLDFDRGLYKAKEPWISPEKSFRQLRNLRLKNGRLVKRKGYTEFGYLGIEVTGETIGNGGIADVGAFSNVPLVPPALLGNTSDTYKITVTDGTYTAYGYIGQSTDPTAVVLQTTTSVITGGPSNYTGSLYAVNNLHSPMTFTDVGGTGQVATVQYLPGPYFGSDALIQSITGDVDSGGTNTWQPPSANPVANQGSYDFTFASPATGTVTASYDRSIGSIVLVNGIFVFTYFDVYNDPVTADYEHLSGEPVMGICSFYTLDGNEYLVAADTNKVWLYNATTERFEDSLGSFTGTDSDFFHFCAFENILVINNGVDPPQKYTPVTPAIAEMGTDYDADTVNEIQAARFCFRHKNRLVYLRTKEGGTDYAQRARWTPVNDVEYAAANGDEQEYYIDAPTTQRITGAEIIGDELLVMFDRSSIWRLHYTGANQFDAFKWERIDNIEGTNSPMGHVSLGNALLWRGRDGIKISDALSVTAADLELPDEVMSWNADAAGYSYGAFITSEREALISFADSGETYPEHAFVAHLDPNRKVLGYSIYDLPFHCFGQYRTGSVPTWDEATAGYTVDQLTWAPDDLIGSIAFPIVLAGNRTGYIYQYADGNDDDGDDVEATLETIRLNPYRFRKCHLGYIDIIASGMPGLTVTLYVTADYDGSPHHQYTIDLTPSGTQTKVCRRVRINRIATFHTIKLVESSGLPFAADAIDLWCKPSGAMRELA